MQITLFGILWTVVLLCVFFLSDTKKILFMALLSMVFQCNNILVIGGTGIGAQIFTISVAMVRFLIVPRANGKKPIGKAIALLLGALMFTVIISLVVNASLDSEHMISLVMLVIYFIFAVMLYRKQSNIDSRWLERAEDFIIVFVLIIGVLQMLDKMGLSVLDGLLRTFIYNDVNNTDVIFHTKSSTAFYATFMEPSFCGAFLVGALSLVITRKELSYKNVFLCVCLTAAILLTRSSTAFGGLAILLCILLFVRSKKKVFKLLIPIFALVALYMFIFNMDMLNEVIFDKINSGSYTVRNNWNESALEAFYANPWFGIGYRNIRASSIFYSILGEIGAVGMTFYGLILLYSVKQLLTKRTDDRVKAAILFVLSVMVCQIIACPDLNFSPFWLGIYLLMLSVRCEEPTQLQKGVTQ